MGCKMKIKNKELLRTIKYTLFMISAGVIQFLVSTVLKLILDATTSEKSLFFIIEFTQSTFIADTVGLFCSIIWNFTFNRKYTFKAANNVPIAMTLALLFYVPFYPFQIWYVDFVEKALISIGIWGYLIGLVSCMIINGVLEFLWQRFVIYRKSVDTSAKATAEAATENESANAELADNADGVANKENMANADGSVVDANGVAANADEVASETATAASEAQE